MDYISQHDRTRGERVGGHRKCHSRPHTTQTSRKRSMRESMTNKFQMFKIKKRRPNPKELQVAPKELSKPVNIKDYENMVAEMHLTEEPEPTVNKEINIDHQTNKDIVEVKAEPIEKGRSTLDADEISSPEKDPSLQIKNPVYKLDTLKSITKEIEGDVILENSKLNDALRSTKKSIDLSEKFPHDHSKSRDSKKDAGNQSNMEISSPKVDIKLRPVSGYQSRRHDESALSEHEYHDAEGMTNITKMNPNNVVNWYKNKKEILRHKKVEENNKSMMVKLNTELYSKSSRDGKDLSYPFGNKIRARESNYVKKTKKMSELNYDMKEDQYYDFIDNFRTQQCLQVLGKPVHNVREFSSNPRKSSRRKSKKSSSRKSLSSAPTGNKDLELGRHSVWKHLIQPSNGKLFYLMKVPKRTNMNTENQFCASNPKCLQCNKLST
ncbi:unnamed protein product [Moneuplotes crassus]|uniref:Uncharacterized protein n=1 Tax=Euplotes crassus TaxID=5936 RepID=A0AAD1Y3Q6_EUPCR|nr:unnamed protein product [Moneuplotes crassus]